MSRWIRALALCTAAALPSAAGPYAGVGRSATPAEIKAWDIDVRPDFKGLPPGSGSVARGQAVWEDKCASCHGTFGESNEVFTPLVGGTTADDVKTGRVQSLRHPETARTTLMKLSTISTLWDYINRAMPWTAPKSLTTEEVYAVVAYLLNLGDIVPADFVLSDANIAEVQALLPNRNGTTRNHGLWDVKGGGDVANQACMKNCGREVRLVSALPAAEAAKLAASESDVADLAKRKACLTCHGIDKRIVGPAFKDVAARYRGDGGAEASLLRKLRRGGSGNWGPLAMPPNPDLAEDDAQTLLRWVLGL
jgi:cytochrome c551/c552